MKLRSLALLPIWLLLIDLWLNIAFNIKDAVMPSAQAMPQDNLPISPQFAFGWIQVFINSSMVILITWAIAVLLRFIKQHSTHQNIKLSGSHYFAALLILAFSIPAAWQWFWAIAALIQGHLNHVDWRNPHYVSTTLLQVYLLLFFSYSAYQYKMKKTPHTASPAAIEHPNIENIP